jgi:uncharacterized protein (DUF2141 family)
LISAVAAGSLIVGLEAGAQVAQGRAQAPTRDSQQQTPQTTVRGVLAGVVVATDTGRIVRRASVAIAGGSPRTVRTVETDETGAFRFERLPPGDYMLRANKGGFVESIYGQKEPGSGRPGVAIRLADNQELAKLSLPIARGGVITGRVADDTGEPAFGVSVQALRWVMDSGERTLEPAGSGVTDDRGIYRVHGLLPGEYVVIARPTVRGIDLGKTTIRVDDVSMDYAKVLKSVDAGNRVELKFAVLNANFEAPEAPKTGFATLFYPGTMQASQAQSVPVTVGDERAGIDFQLLVVPFGTLSGAVTMPDGSAARTEVQLIDRGQPPGVGIRNARTDATGRFSFTTVPPGQYAVIARGAPKGRELEAGVGEAVSFYAAVQDEAKAAQIAKAMAGATPLWAMADVSSDGRDVGDISLMLRSGSTVSGSVQFEAASGPPPTATRLLLTVTPVGHSLFGENAPLVPATVDAQGRFTIRGLPPGRYRLAVSGGAPGGYALKSAVFGGMDVLDFPLEVNGNDPIVAGVVTLSNRTTEVSGAVQSTTGEPATGVTIIAFALEERFWLPEARRIQAVRPSTDGKYSFRNLPAGEYRVAVVMDVAPGQWFDPAFLRAIGSFVNLSVSEGARLTQDLRIK